MPLQPASTGKQLIKHHKTKGCYSCQSRPARTGVRILSKSEKARRTKSGVKVYVKGVKKT